ncbi:MAG: serine/threonine protein kinase, partial [Phycisphaerae bacterium]
MTSDGIERELELFSELLQQPPEDRDAFLEKRHGSHPEIMRRLKRLLAAHENAQRTDAETAPMIAPVHTPDSSGAGEHPSMIDRYRVLSVLGEGGMGVVYIAEQSQPVQRQVALKVIKPGMDCASVIKRFERERQTLAIMDHPNVAKVFDGGVIGEGHVGAGRPYFAMELVDGRPITEYCDQKRLSIEERLELFLGVCRGLEHAHQRGIIHRDIKPSNVLCTERDGEGAPVIIDFGVAKALESSVDHATQRTELGVIIGTPDYMSPEQADGDTNAIDTRSDVYSLGALLYELLCGRTVFDLARGGVSISRIREIVLTQEPMKPSTRFNELGESVEARAHHRAADPYVLRRKIHNDLDWVVLKALQKNPDARYPSARALA